MTVVFQFEGNVLCIVSEASLSKFIEMTIFVQLEGVVFDSYCLPLLSVVCASRSYCIIILRDLKTQDEY